MSRIISLPVTLCASGLAAEQGFSPYAMEKPQSREVYWGDTHLHSKLSTDAPMVTRERAYSSPIWYPGSTR